MTNLGAIIGNNLKGVRGKIAQSEFAESFDVSPRTYQRYESGERIAPDELIDKVIERYDLSLSDILKIDNTPGMINTPVSKTLQKMMKIPDEVYERASKIDINDSIWEDAIIPALVHAEERKRLASLHKT